MNNVNRGALVFVVGPSGVGKDSVLNATRCQTGAHPWCRVARRYITRAATADGEPSIEVSRPRFVALETAGLFILSWRAHNTCYGIPANVRTLVDNGAIVLVNGSREQIPRLRKLPDLVTRVVAITADERTIRERLRARGRETEQQIGERLARGRRLADVSDVDFELVNDATVHLAAQRLIEFCRSHRCDSY